MRPPSSARTFYKVVACLPSPESDVALPRYVSIFDGVTEYQLDSVTSPPDGCSLSLEVPLVEPVASGPPAMVDPAKMLTMEEIARREERAKKWEVNLEEKKWDPLAAIATASGPKAFWEKRRDASPDEQPRPEAIHAFGTDRMSTEDLMLYFIEPGVTTEEDAPQWVEWVNDSSANVVFGSADAAAQ